MGDGMTIEALVRKDDWRASFDAECDRLWRTPFSWETQDDCVLGLAGNLVTALTGVDMVAQYRGVYQDEAGALKVIHDAGFTSIGDMVASMLPEYEHPSMATVGDIVAIDTDSEFKHALGVVNGERILVLTTRGVGTIDRGRASRAFKVG